MLALIAAIVFGIGFLLQLVGVNVPAEINLTLLGLMLFALNFATPLPGRQRRR